MKDNELKIKKAFMSADPLPEKVEKGMKETYEIIYSQVRGEKDGDGYENDERDNQNSNERNIMRRQDNQNKIRRVEQEENRAVGMIKVACIVAACFVIMGASAAAVGAILNRFEKMKAMDEKEKEQIATEIQSGGAVDFISSRKMTEEELARYQELKEAYENNEKSPQKEIDRLNDGEEYSGSGVCLAFTGQGEENIIYLPKSTLTDEELLEIIEYRDKRNYVFAEERQKAEYGEEVWKERLEKMTDEEVDYYYLAFFSASTELAGGYCRGEQSTRKGDKVLSEAEQELYQEMVTAYQEEMRIPSEKLRLIEKPDEYDGDKVAFCRWNALYYLPERELTQEDCLEMIDFQTRAQYSSERIRREIDYGYRTGMPHLDKTTKKTPIKLEKKAFSDTQGQERAISDASIGDIVKFGSYEQDGNFENGKEVISWYVLDETEDGLMLLSVDVLDGQKFHEQPELVSWEKCDLRKWLNGKFYNEAFSEKEQGRMLAKEVENDYGGNTKDYVTLLSIKEYLEFFGISADAPGADPYKPFYEGIYEVGISKAEKERRMREFMELVDPRTYAKVTPASLLNEDGERKESFWPVNERTVENFLYDTNVDCSDWLGCSTWWLRDVDPEIAEPSAYHTGLERFFQANHNNWPRGVRPVIWIKK